MNEHIGNVNRLKIQNSEKHELIIKLEENIYTITDKLETSKENITKVEHMYKISKNTISRLDGDI